MSLKKNLCFECQRCLYCCSVEPGYVFLSALDIANGAKAAGIGEDEFVKIYCRYVDYGHYQMITLKEKKNFDCIFLTPNGCSIYSGRPVQCRTYPFWKNLMESESSWRREALSCPGIGKGNRVSQEYIDNCLKENEENTPIIIMKGQKNPYK